MVNCLLLECGRVQYPFCSHLCCYRDRHGESAHINKSEGMDLLALSSNLFQRCKKRSCSHLSWKYYNGLSIDDSIRMSFSSIKSQESETAFLPSHSTPVQWWCLQRFLCQTEASTLWAVNQHQRLFFFCKDGDRTWIKDKRTIRRSHQTCYYLSRVLMGLGDINSTLSTLLPDAPFESPSNSISL